MFDGLRVLAIVPARGGSKGVLRKNIRYLSGEPLIGYTLRTALMVEQIDLLVVSTDDSEITDVSAGYGVRAMQRPAELATDLASTESALIHVINTLLEEGQSFDIVLVLEPTSPFRSFETIMRGIKVCVDGPAPSIVAVRETRENIGFISGDYFRPILPGAPRSRQKRNPIYIESRTIYVCRIDYLLSTGTLVADDWGVLVVPDAEALDINTEDDFLFAEFLMQYRRKIQND